MNHTCTITSWHRFYRLPILRLIDLLFYGRTSVTYRCMRCGAYKRFGKKGKCRV